VKLILIISLLTLSLFGNIGTVTALKGEAKLTHNDSVTKLTLNIGISEKDFINTASQSRVQVILNDDTVITIGPESEYYFEAFQDQGDIHVQMRIERGFFKSVTGKIGKISPERFIIKTKASSIGVRGTQFMAYVEKDEEKIGCIQGAIIVWTNSGLTFDVPAGKMLVYKDGEWILKEINVKLFAPVMLGMSFNDVPQLDVPEAQKQYLIDEQALKRRTPPTIPDIQPATISPSSEPFDVQINVDNSTQPPPYNP